MKMTGLGCLLLGTGLLWGCVLKKTTSPASNLGGVPGVETPPVGTGNLPTGTLTKGVNLGNALDAPTEGQWGVSLVERHFSLVEALGADHVRLPVRFSAHTGAAPAYVIDPIFLARVDWAMARAAAHGLSIIIDWHHYNELAANPNAERPRFLAVWRQLAEHCASQPDSVVFELLNEPYGQLDRNTWGQLAQDALAVVRESNPARRVIIDGPEWANAPAFGGVVVPDDSNVILSFHMYEPHLFTVQGSPWMGTEYSTTGAVFPAPPQVRLAPTAAAAAVPWVRAWFSKYNTLAPDRNPCARAAIDSILTAAAEVGARANKPVYMGEFAVVDWADMDSRVNWLRAVRTKAESLGIGWAVWDDGGHNRFLDVSRNCYVPELRAALFPEK